MDPVTALWILLTVVTLGGCAYVIAHYLWSKLGPGAVLRRKAERASLRQTYGLEGASPTPSEKARLASPLIPVVWVILLTLVTAGIYSGVWAIKRTRELNEAGFEPMSQAGPITLLLLSILTAPTMFMEFQDPTFNTVLSGINLIYVIITVLIAIGMRRRLSVLYPQASSLFTLFLTFFYLQYVINRIQRHAEAPTPSAA